MTINKKKVTYTVDISNMKSADTIIMTFLERKNGNELAQFMFNSDDWTSFMACYAKNRSAYDLYKLLKSNSTALV